VGETLLLSRIHFGLSIGFHFLFPIATLGITFFIVIFESLYFFKRDDRFLPVSKFFIKLLAVVFTMGVATGLLMPFAFGTNWSRFSMFAGTVLGSALSFEATLAFALESSFLAILLFGRERVSKGMFLVAAVMVFAAAHLSGFLIVAVNSWMHTPAGIAIVNGKIVRTDLVAAIFNPSTPVRFLHVITACWLSGAFIVAASGAYFALRRTSESFSRITLRLAVPIALVLAVLQPVWGHFHIMEVLHHSPVKDAAYEGIFESVDGAPLYMAGIPDQANRRIRFGIGAPYMLSFLESGHFKSHVKGLNEFPVEEWPPVNVIFTTFHLMVGLGILLIAIAGVASLLLWKKRLFSSKWALTALLLCVPLPFVANELGWIGTEMGRQPWIIYGILKTGAANTASLPSWQIALSLSLCSLVYIALAALMFLFVKRHYRNGPENGGGRIV
jgi:cytochrome bd ubiquinol oxidase subunit I